MYFVQFLVLPVTVSFFGMLGHSIWTQSITYPQMPLGNMQLPETPFEYYSLLSLMMFHVGICGYFLIK